MFPTTLWMNNISTIGAFIKIKHNEKQTKKTFAEIHDWGFPFSSQFNTHLLWKSWSQSPGFSGPVLGQQFCDHAPSCTSGCLLSPLSSFCCFWACVHLLLKTSQEPDLAFWLVIFLLYFLSPTDIYFGCVYVLSIYLPVNHLWCSHSSYQFIEMEFTVIVVRFFSKSHWHYLSAHSPPPLCLHPTEN